MLKIAGDLFRYIKTVSLSPGKRALSITIGFYLSLFPVTGLTTILCLLAIVIFKLNPFLVQGINILFMPIQVILMLPFLKAGRIMFFTEKELLPEISQVKLSAFIRSDSLYYLFESIMGGVAVWSIVSVTTGFFLYRLLLKMN